MADIVLGTINAKWIHPSLALRLLKANLGELEDSAIILEFALRQPLKEQIGAIIAGAPKILGLSVSIWNHLPTLALLEELRRFYATGGTQAPAVVLGGPEVSFLREDAEIFRYADWVIRGEGEEPFRKLCAFLLGKRGTWSGPSRDGVTLPRAIFIDAEPADTAALTSAYSLYTYEDLEKKLLYVEASRGCPFRCAFCLSAVNHGKDRDNGINMEEKTSQAVREFPLEAFLDDMDGLIKRGARVFKFLDRSFNVNIKRGIRILEFFLERLNRAGAGDGLDPGSAGEDPPFYLHLEMVPQGFPSALRSLLRRFPPGSLRLEVGIQTLNPKVAALINRAGNAAEALEALSFLRLETQAIVHADLIAGLPGEDLSSFGHGFDALWLALSGGKSQARVEIQPGILKLLPGTPIAALSEDFRMRYSPDPPYEVMETGALSEKDLNRIKNFARFWELIINRGKFLDFEDALAPPLQPVFKPFMALSDWLLERFGRNWGIDRRELRSALEEFLVS